MVYTTIGQYSLAIAISPDQVSHTARADSLVREKLISQHDDQAYLAVGVSNLGLSPDLLVEGWYSPGPENGFHPGILVIPETEVVFIGAGTTVLCFSMAPIAKLDHREVEVGFWSWVRYGAKVIMCSELEFAVWNIHGKKLWSQFVEPPWSYEIQGEIVVLEVMGFQKRVNLENGDQE